MGCYDLFGEFSTLVVFWLSVPFAFRNNSLHSAYLNCTNEVLVLPQQANGQLDQSFEEGTNVGLH
jgi:hypothetical protein